MSLISIVISLIVIGVLLWLANTYIPMSKDLPGLVSQTQTSMREVERLVEAMQRHWLLRKYVNKKSPAPVARNISGWTAGEELPKEPVKSLRSPRDSIR